jgi:NitT/TauT family transport system ATP-binding protein
VERFLIYAKLHESQAEERALAERATGETILEARGLEKYYLQADGHRIDVIAPTDMSIRAGEFIALLGPSGAGKSTLLRMLAGLAKPSSGVVLWHGQPLDGQRPKVGVVFQSFALFPWLRVIENVEAPLLAAGMPAIQRRKLALKILDAVGLDGFEAAYPKELSGGMKQRVGFARALVVEPEVLFMDEPFSSLDVLTAENLRGELLELWVDRKIPTRTIFLVTHNIDEAVLLADRIVVLGRNPARVRADFRVEESQPRDRKSSSFVQVVDRVYKILTKPEVEHPPTPAAPDTALGTASRRYPMLPHARPGGMSGLLEILADRGREDVYHLAAELLIEADDLLTILEAAQLLRFIHIQEGDVEVTPEGRAFAEADIDTRKKLFREAALQHVPLLRQIASALRAKADRRLPEEFFLDLLDEHFTRDEARQQLDTALDWGRYAEIFDYAPDSRRLFLSDFEMRP